MIRHAVMGAASVAAGARAAHVRQAIIRIQATFAGGARRAGLVDADVPWRCASAAGVAFDAGVAGVVAKEPRRAGVRALVVHAGVASARAHE